MVQGARGLRRADWLPGMGTSDCFCKVSSVGRAGDASCLMTTKTINDCLTPIWKEEMDIPDFKEGNDLEFSLWDADAGKPPDALGKVVLKNADFAERGFNGELLLQDAGKDIMACVRVKVKVAG